MAAPVHHPNGHLFQDRASSPNIVIPIVAKVGMIAGFAGHIVTPAQKREIRGLCLALSCVSFGVNSYYDSSILTRLRTLSAQLFTTDQSILEQKAHARSEYTELTEDIAVPANDASINLYTQLEQATDINEIHRLTEAIRQEISRLKTAEAQRLRTQNTILTVENTELKGQLQASRQAVDDLRQELTGVKNTNTHLNREINALNVTTSRLEKEMDEMKKFMQQMQVSFNLKNSENEKLSLQNEELKKENAGLKEKQYAHDQRQLESERKKLNAHGAEGSSVGSFQVDEEAAAKQRALESELRAQKRKARMLAETEEPVNVVPAAATPPAAASQSSSDEAKGWTKIEQR